MKANDAVFGGAILISADAGAFVGVLGHCRCHVTHQAPPRYIVQDRILTIQTAYANMYLLIQNKIMPEELQQISENYTQPSFDLAASLDAYKRDNERLAAELASDELDGKFPEWWYGEQQVSESELQRHLVNNDVPGEAILDYYYAKDQRAALGSKISGREQYSTTIDMLYNSVMGELTAEKFALALKAEPIDGKLHNDILQGFEDTGINMPTTQSDILRAYYGLGSATELYGVNGEGYDAQVHAVVRTEKALNAISFMDQEKFGPDASLAEMYKYKSEWSTRVVAWAAGIPEAEAASYTFGIEKRSHEREALGRMLEKIDNFGIDTLRKLARETGIHAFDAYSTRQLVRMVQLVQNDENSAETIKSKDITVAMINRVGDHNGVLRDVAPDFEQDNGSTSLFFEINSLADIYRYSAKLRSWGVQPSVLVLAAHSSEGQFMVVDERNPEVKKFEVAAVAGRRLVARLNQTNGWTDREGLDVSGQAIESLDSLTRLIDDFMKPSRLDGTKKVIFQACHAASEAPVNELSKGGRERQIGQASVIGRLAETLEKNGVKSIVELYGAEGGIQLHRSDKGVKYTGQPTGFDSGRTPKHAKRIRLENGHAVTEDIDEVVLRK
jgi:hypothetical protein